MGTTEMNYLSFLKTSDVYYRHWLLRIWNSFVVFI